MNNGWLLLLLLLFWGGGDRREAKQNGWGGRTPFEGTGVSLEQKWSGWV